MPQMPVRSLAITAIALLAVVLAPAASADKAFHTLHAELHPVAGAPLRAGFVNDVHTNGVVNAAHEIYHLSGARPNTTYTITISLYPGDPTCSTAPLTFPTTTLTTNGAGNGNARFTFPAGPPSGLEGITHGIRWQFASATGVDYATDCHPLTLD
jgi:hypothetical protein